MAAKKYTQLPVAEVVNADDIIAIVQGGVSKQADISLLPSSGGSIVVLWDFAAEGGFPEDPNKLYIATDDSVVPNNTWFVANTPTPTGIGDFYYK